MYRYIHKKIVIVFDQIMDDLSIRTLLVLSFLITSTGLSFAQKNHPHINETFGWEKKFRIFLPEDDATSLKHDSVNYDFHGNKESQKFTNPEVAKQHRHKIKEWEAISKTSTGGYLLSRFERTPC